MTLRVLPGSVDDGLCRSVFTHPVKMERLLCELADGHRGVHEHNYRLNNPLIEDPIKIQWEQEWRWPEPRL